MTGYGRKSRKLSYIDCFGALETMELPYLMKWDVDRDTFLSAPHQVFTSSDVKLWNDVRLRDLYKAQLLEPTSNYQLLRVHSIEK